MGPAFRQWVSRCFQFSSLAFITIPTLVQRGLVSDRGHCNPSWGLLGQAWPGLISRSGHCCAIGLGPGRARLAASYILCTSEAPEEEQQLLLCNLSIIAPLREISEDTAFHKRGDLSVSKPLLSDAAFTFAANNTITTSSFVTDAARPFARARKVFSARSHAPEQPRR